MLPSQPDKIGQTVRSPWTGDELVAVLRAYGVPFLASEELAAAPPALPAAELLAALASHPEARLRLALIPLLLRRPELVAAVPHAARQLPASAQFTLRSFYTAAYLLQQKHRTLLTARLGEQPALPDCFSVELGIPLQGTPDDRLHMLGRRQAEGSGRRLNWTGSYEHAAERLLTRLTREMEWKQTR